MEEVAVLSYSSFLQKAVLAPGGSIVYSPAAMEHLKKISTVVFLDAPLEEVKNRIAMGGRGIVGGKEKSLEQLYAERLRPWVNPSCRVQEERGTLAVLLVI